MGSTSGLLVQALAVTCPALKRMELYGWPLDRPEDKPAASFFSSLPKLAGLRELVIETTHDLPPGAARCLSHLGLTTLDLSNATLLHDEVQLLANTASLRRLHARALCPTSTIDNHQCSWQALQLRRLPSPMEVAFLPLIGGVQAQ